MKCTNSLSEEAVTEFILPLIPVLIFPVVIGYVIFFLKSFPFYASEL